MPHLHKLAAVAITVAVVVGLLAPHASGHRNRAARPAAARSLRPAAVRHSRPAAPRFDRVRAAAAARAAGADELGEVPVLMIHRVFAKPSTTLDRTPAQLYAEFTRLARENYVPVTAAEFVTGRMNVPAGRHPVVLTFDDGSDSQFALDANGSPKPDTAVAVIERVAREHPGFRPVATFFVNEDPFAGGDGPAMRWLAQHGFEVANHTAHHRDLAGMSKHEIAKEIGTDQQAIAGATGRPPVTFAYPFGVPPHLEWVARGAGWRFRGMFLAAWKPADSPFEKDFDPRQIPRIRDDGKIKEDGCKLFCSAAWLDWLARNPDKRYTSDGNPATIAFPRAKMIDLGKRFKAQACPY
jgi:peptidoglycan/xylan/chitin deacetylase (PgdA/CDA1 family)